MAQYIKFSMPKKKKDAHLLYIIVHHLLLFINWPTIFFTVGDKSLDWTAQRAQTDDSTFNKYYICCVLRNNTNYNRCNSKSFKFQSLILWWEYNLLGVAAVYTWREKKSMWFGMQHRIFCNGAVQTMNHHKDFLGVQSLWPCLQSGYHQRKHRNTSFQQNDPFISFHGEHVDYNQIHLQSNTFFCFYFHVIILFSSFRSVFVCWHVWTTVCLHVWTALHSLGSEMDKWPSCAIKYKVRTRIHSINLF